MMSKCVGRGRHYWHFMIILIFDKKLMIGPTLPRPPSAIPQRGGMLWSIKWPADNACTRQWWVLCIPRLKIHWKCCWTPSIPKTSWTQKKRNRQKNWRKTPYMIYLGPLMMGITSMGTIKACSRSWVTYDRRIQISPCEHNFQCANLAKYVRIATFHQIGDWYTCLEHLV